MMMLIPEAWAGNPLMDPKRTRLLRISRRADGAVGRPGRDRLHRRPPDRRHARPQRPAPRALHASPTTTRSIMASEAGVLPIPEEKHRPQVAAAARQDAADRPRAGPHRRGRGDQGDARRGRALRGVAEGDAVQARGAVRAARRAGARAVQRSDHACSIASRPSATPRRTSSSSSSRWRASGDDPVGSMGTDTPIAVLSGPAQAALQLLQAELRPGHQPADRPDPRGAGDVAGVDDRAAAQPARPPRRHAQAAGSRRSRS